MRSLHHYNTTASTEKCHGSPLAFRCSARAKILASSAQCCASPMSPGGELQKAQVDWAGRGGGWNSLTLSTRTFPPPRSWLLCHPLSSFNVGVGNSNDSEGCHSYRGLGRHRDRLFQGRREHFQRQCHRSRYPRLSRRVYSNMHFGVRGLGYILTCDVSCTNPLLHVSERLSSDGQGHHPGQGYASPDCTRSE